MTPRLIAIDWSGARDRAEKKIWLSETAADGHVVRLEAGRNRAAVMRHLIEEIARDPDLVVGLDFAFSMPEWFVAERHLDDAPGLWGLVEREGEEWLSTCDPPFWGRAGRPRPALREHLRRTEREIPATSGIRPKSVFQIGGAGAVGTGSIRGMPILTQLRAAGFAVWPFDAPRLPMLIEIYPRVLTGSVVRANAEERRLYLEVHHPDLDSDVFASATSSEDAFDALVSALAMAAHASEFASMGTALDEVQRLEGQIWLPAVARKTPTTQRGRFNSSKTRVAPVFSALRARAKEEPQWLRRLLDLVPRDQQRNRTWHAHDLSVQSIHYARNERALQPPVGLLSWLVRNFNVPSTKIRGHGWAANARRKLAAKDPHTIERALELLRRGGTGKGWHILEGPTYPDVLAVTPDALVVIEGKRTEAGPTTSTTWMAGRHQMLRHLDGAWEIRGQRTVYGFFVVEADCHGGVPAHWIEAADATRSRAAIQGSLPHRSTEEQSAIVEGFLGVTTWQAIVNAFGLNPAVLADNVDTRSSR